MRRVCCRNLADFLPESLPVGGSGQLKPRPVPGSQLALRATKASAWQPIARTGIGRGCGGWCAEMLPEILPECCRNGVNPIYRTRGWKLSHGDAVDCAQGCTSLFLPGLPLFLPDLPLFLPDLPGGGFCSGGLW